MIEVLNPTFDDETPAFDPAPRLESLRGATVGILSNGKHATEPFFEALAEVLQSRYGVAEIVRTTKPNYSAPAPADVLEPARTWHALISGVGD